VNGQWVQAIGCGEADRLCSLTRRLAGIESIGFEFEPNCVKAAPAVANDRIGTAPSRRQANEL
jgi:hypothetical protein